MLFTDFLSKIANLRLRTNKTFTPRSEFCKIYISLCKLKINLLHFLRKLKYFHHLQQKKKKSYVSKKCCGCFKITKYKN